MARTGESDAPVQAAPTALRPVLRFTRLPAQALEITRRVLDGDEDFRRRVAGAVGEVDVGRAGWLFLHRPEGWEEELEALTAAATEAQREEAERRADAAAGRRVELAEAATARATESLAGSRGEVARLSAALAAERQARSAAQEEIAALRGAVEAGETEWRAAAARAVAAMAAWRERAEVLAAENQALRVTLEPYRDDTGRGPDPDQLSELSSRVADASKILAGLAVTLSEVADDLTASPPEVVAEPVGDSDEDGPDPSGRTRPGLAHRRTPLPLPPGVFDDSVEAAVHLVRTPGAIVLVDGYNVSHEGWPGLAPSDHRRRLLDALTELAARTAARIEVVFDGAEETLMQPVAAVRRSVKVSFSPPGVEADHVIVDRVEALPPGQAVIVASSDNWVRSSASRAGANVVSASQLLGAMGRRF